MATILSWGGGGGGWINIEFVGAMYIYRESLCGKHAT